jgi:DNA repair protein RadC
MILRIRKKWREMLSVCEGKPAVSCRDDVTRVFRELISSMDSLDRETEHIWALGLDSRHRVVYLQLASIGCWHCAPIDPKIILQAALVYSCTSIILVHNHPSGDPTPSSDDKFLTRKIAQASEIVGIKLIDHIIVTEDPEKSYSFLENSVPFVG